MTAVEPARTGPREFTTYASNTPLPAVLISYPQPDSRSADLPALVVLDAILANGESSRLYQSMVYQEQVAAEVLTNLEATQDPGAYAIGAILSEGKTADEGLASLNRQVARLRDELVTDAELDEAKNEIVTATIEGRETAYGRAFELAESVIRYGDPTYADTMLAAIQRTTAADVQRVARTILNDNQRVTIRYLSDEARGDAQGDTIATREHHSGRPADHRASGHPNLHAGAGSLACCAARRRRARQRAYPRDCRAHAAEWHAGDRRLVAWFAADQRGLPPSRPATAAIPRAMPVCRNSPPISLARAPRREAPPRSRARLNRLAHRWAQRRTPIARPSRCKPARTAWTRLSPCSPT